MRRHHILDAQGAESKTSIGPLPGVLGMPVVPRRLPDTASLRAAGTRVSDGTKMGSSRALAALKHSVRLITTIRYMSDLPTTGRRQWNGNAADDRDFGEGEARPDDGSSDSDEGEDLTEDGKALADGNRQLEGAAGGAMIASRGPKRGSKFGPKRDTGDRRWAMTVQFYEHVATAAARLESKRTADRGCACCFTKQNRRS